MVKYFPQELQMFHKKNRELSVSIKRARNLALMIESNLLEN